MVQSTHVLRAQFRERGLTGSFGKSQSGLTRFMCSNDKWIQPMIKKPLNGAHHGEFFTFVHPIHHVQFRLKQTVTGFMIGFDNLPISFEGNNRARCF